MSVPLLEYNATHRFGEKIETPYFTFTMLKTDLYDPDYNESSSTFPF